MATAKLQDEIVAAVDEDKEEEEPSNGTFVAVIITLGVLCLALLCAGFVGWWFWIRPTEWKHIEETASVDNVKVEVNGRSTDEMMEKERPSMVINGNTWTGKFCICETVENFIRYFALIHFRIHRQCAPAHQEHSHCRRGRYFQHNSSHQLGR